MCKAIYNKYYYLQHFTELKQLKVKNNKLYKTFKDKSSF